VLDQGRALVFCATDRPAARAALEARGAEIVVLPDAQGKVDLPGMLRELGRREVNEVLVETGTRLNGALLAAGCVDELLLYLAPSLVGERGIGMFDLPEMTRLEQQARLEIVEARQLGADLRLRARVRTAPVFD
jgi:diaminohydroxyphosphoribosylaminopyrimidine deaminase/5-amino-6-(5-phosphoribosylamino)uracil reductase